MGAEAGGGHHVEGVRGRRGAVRTTDVPKALGGTGSVAHTAIALLRFREVIRWHSQP